MLDIEQELRRLPKVNPTSQFCEEAKGRLMHQISFDAHERWFVRLLKMVAPVNPSAQFLQMARIRLLARIEGAARPMLGWLLWAQRALASTLVLVIAVTTTLFFVEGRQPVSASENTTLQVVSGEVSVKHADQLIWDTITQPTDLSAGDLIRVGEMASATIHFFDDTELRLGQNSILLVDRLSVSPAFARQGIINVSLHQGMAWVQILNVDDGYANFSLSTSNAMLSARDATFDVQTGLFDPTHIRVFRHSILAQALQPETREVISTGKLNANEQVVLDGSANRQRSSALAAFSRFTPISSEDRDSDWAKANLVADQGHLNGLRERELIALKANTGTLPGQLLYPIKRAKERLEMAFNFDEKAQINLLAYMANQRLSEAIVLLGQNDTEQAKISLSEYQALVQQIADEKQGESVDEKPLAALVVAHRKALVAALPSDIQIVNNVLNQTEEILAEDPVQLAQVRLQNALGELTNAYDSVLSGDLVAAQAMLASHRPIADDLLGNIALMTEDQMKSLYSSLLESQYEEKRLFVEISRELVARQGDQDLIAMAQEQASNLEGAIRETVASIRPAMPEVVLAQAAAFSKTQKAKEFAQKVAIYKTWQGQKNQVKRMIAKYPQYAYDQSFWAKVRDNLDGTARVVIESRISELQYQDAVIKSKQMKQKIDTLEGRKIYSQRLRIVEPVFANIRAQKKLDRLTLRGRGKVNIQWRLYCLVHNIEKILHFGRSFTQAA